MMFAAVCAFAGCLSKEETNPGSGETVTEGTEFVLNLNPPTKTVNDGLGTKWIAGDKVNVFHAVAGTEEYVNDGAFEYTSGSSFSGKLAGSLDADKAYDWYVAYPYDENMTSPKAMTINIPGDQYQESDGSMASGSVSSQRPMMTFCWLPPDRARILVSWEGVLVCMASM